MRKVLNVLMVILLMLSQTSQVFALTSLGKPGSENRDSNNVWFDYWSNSSDWETAGESEDNPVESFSMLFSHLNGNSTERVRRPIAKFEASYGGNTVRSESGKVLKVAEGATVTFSDSSTAGSGSRINKYDFQIHSANKSMADQKYNSVIGSYKFNKTGTYYVYLNVYDDTDSSYTRNWGNYSVNGKRHVGTFRGCYGVFPYAMVVIEVCSKPLITVEHIVISTGYQKLKGYNGFEYEKPTEVEVGKTITVSSIPESQLNNYSPKLKYKGFNVGPKDSKTTPPRGGASYSFTAKENENMTIRFLYIQLGAGGAPIEPPESDEPLPKPPRGDWTADFVWTEGFYDEADRSGTIEWSYFDEGSETIRVPGDADRNDLIYELGREKITEVRWDGNKPHADYKYTRGSANHENCTRHACVGRYYTDNHGRAIAAVSFPMRDLDQVENNHVDFKWIFEKYVPTEIPAPPGTEVPEIPVAPVKPLQTADISTNINLNVTDMYMNYKNLDGYIGGEAESSYKISDNGTGAKLKDRYTEISFMDFSYGNKGYTKSTSGNTVSSKHTLSRDDIGSLLVGMPGVSTSYQYGMRAYTKATLNKTTSINGVTEQIASESVDGGFGELKLTNEKPIAAIKMNSNYNGSNLKEGYYYKDTPIEIESTFEDPEKDLVYSKIEIGKGSNVGDQIVYSNTVGENNAGIDITDSNELLLGEEYTVSKSDNDITKMKQTYTPLKEGVYWYRLECTDAKELKELQKTGISSGVFKVRSEVAPPQAVITEPTFAFENEAVEYRQDSTDPNGVDDIQRYEWKLPDNVKDVPNINTKDGGTITFSSGTSQKTFNLELKVTDTTNLSNSTIQKIKVIEDIPIARLGVKDNDGSSIVKENRKITVTADKSLSSKRYPIKWDKTVWEIYSLDANKNKNIHISKSDTNNNKQRVLQFDTPGEYYVKIKLSNEYSINNADSPDIGASETILKLTVVEDKVPKISASVKSPKPNFIDNPTSTTVEFKAEAKSIDADKIVTPSAYKWKIYEDSNNNGLFEDSELMPTNRITVGATGDTVVVKVNYELGRHNKLKAEATATETFGEPTLKEFLNINNNSIRQSETSITETVNWVPSIKLNAGAGQDYESLDPKDANYSPTMKYIKVYTDDNALITTSITDEIPSTCRVEWDLVKMVKGGEYTENRGINDRVVTSVLGHDGGTIRIDETGLYQLKAIVRDDGGEVGKDSIYIRVYKLPEARLEANPKYNIYNEAWDNSTTSWTTKENIRFDIRSNPTIVDDEWGKAWHTMDFSKDCFEITPLEGQSVDNIHVMNENYVGGIHGVYGDKNVSIKNSRLGLIGNNVGKSNYRAISFTQPGVYEFKYWGTNYKGKITVPVAYRIRVEEDLKPVILGEVGNQYYRDVSDGNRANIALLGPYNSELGKQVLTVQSPDRDYIDYSTMDVVYDSDNNKVFNDKDVKWHITEDNTATIGIEYVFKRVGEK